MLEKVIEATDKRIKEFTGFINSDMKQRLERFFGHDITHSQRIVLHNERALEVKDWPIIAGCSGDNYVFAISEIVRTFKDPYKFMENTLEEAVQAVLGEGETIELTVNAEAQTFSMKFKAK